MHTDDLISDLILRAWADVVGERANTAHALARAFAEQPRLAPAQRAAVVNGLFGMLHSVRRIDFALESDSRAARDLIERDHPSAPPSALERPNAGDPTSARERVDRRATQSTNERDGSSAMLGIEQRANERDASRTLLGTESSANERHGSSVTLGTEPSATEGDASRAMLGTVAIDDRRRYVAWRLISGEASPADADVRALGIDAERVMRVDERIAEIEDPMRRFALTQSLPDVVADRLLAEHGADAEPLCNALRRRAPLTLRVNTLKTTRDALIERLGGAGIRARATRFASDGIVLDEHANVFELAEFHAGLFEVQDEASQLAAELVAAPPRGTVVDFCAGAGGKTLAIGARMNNQGRVVALDPSARRLKELRRRAARAGLFNVQHAPHDLASLHARADRVLTDVPCSGLGALRRKPDIRLRIGADDLERLPREQFEIASRALELVAPGGRLIYATCTLLANENERVVERLLARGGVELVKVKEILGSERASAITDASGTFLKLFPHRHDTDGFFAAVLRRTRE
jgi:16S rRNA (cytosine967-C5)-methyltransferase